MRFTNKIVVITGGGGEIGRATAERFAREGATAVIVDLNREPAESAAAEINAAGGAAWAFEMDVARRDQVEAMADAVIARHGRIDVLCNIAGIAPPAPFLETSDANWDATLDVNLKGVFLCSQIVARQMVALGVKGNIVNMASTNGLVGEVGLVAYNASKFGV
ncbi:MAG TPA: SDR family oxidoreductase, partial [Blastocatellia bacterium]|nr:SDR family oxidoreductase [Blastocatellia bacterium]